MIEKIANTTNNNTNRYEKAIHNGFTVLFSLGACYGQLSPKVGGNPYLIESSAALRFKVLLYDYCT
jgi:hypothetical protein